MLDRGYEIQRQCPYCYGRGRILVLLEPPVGGKEIGSATWSRRNCPLCDGKGHIAGRTPQPDITTTERAEALLNELRAINYWDGQYDRHRAPNWNETVAYISRQRRRGEIIRQLLRFRQDKRTKK